MESLLTLFVWSKSRIVPVRNHDFSVTEEAFDPVLNPLRAKVSIGLRVLTSTIWDSITRRQPVHDLPAAERTARRQKPGGTLSALGIGGIA